MPVWIVESFSLPGAIHEPVTISARTLGAFYWLFIMVCFTSFTGNLIAFLTVSKVVMPVKTLDDLASQDTIKFGMQEGIIQSMLFKVCLGLYE